MMYTKIIQRFKGLTLTVHQSIIFASLKNTSIYLKLRTKISMELFKNNIFFHLPPTSGHLHSLQIENCDSNSRVVVDEYDNGKFRIERVKALFILHVIVCYCVDKIIYGSEYSSTHML